MALTLPRSAAAAGPSRPTGTISHVNVEIRRGSDRFLERARGRMTHHAFSFGEHYDPARVAFGPMLCHDDHVLRAGNGFDTHRHADPDGLAGAAGFRHRAAADPAA